MLNTAKKNKIQDSLMSPFAALEDLTVQVESVHFSGYFDIASKLSLSL